MENICLKNEFLLSKNWLKVQIWSRDLYQICAVVKMLSLYNGGIMPGRDYDQLPASNNTKTQP